MGLFRRRSPAGQSIVPLKDVVDIEKHADTVIGFGHGKNMAGVDAGAKDRSGVDMRGTSIEPPGPSRSGGSLRSTPATLIRKIPVLFRTRSLTAARRYGWLRQRRPRLPAWG